MSVQSNSKGKPWKPFWLSKLLVHPWARTASQEEGYSALPAHGWADPDCCEEAQKVCHLPACILPSQKNPLETSFQRDLVQVELPELFSVYSPSLEKARIVCPAPRKSGAQWINLETEGTLGPHGFLPTSRLCLRTGLCLIWSYSRGGTGGDRNEPFPKAALGLGWHEDLQKVFVLLRIPGSCTLLCPSIMGMAGKRAGAAKRGQEAPVCALCVNIDSFVLSLFSCGDLGSTYTSGNLMQQAITKPFWSSACFL